MHNLIYIRTRRHTHTQHTLEEVSQKRNHVEDFAVFYSSLPLATRDVGKEKTSLHIIKDVIPFDGYGCAAIDGTHTTRPRKRYYPTLHNRVSC
jgi:hypothetical protein